MGAPESLSDMKLFLQRMFRDPNIIPLSKPLRFLVACIISTVRYKKSWAKYQLIGGSPLKKSCKTIADELAKKTDIQTFVAYSYSNPSIAETAHSMIAKGITEITVLPMYPQYSFSTSRSVQQDIERLMPSSIHYTFIKEYYNNPLFVAFWTRQIKMTITETGVTHPTLLFSAHSVPQYHIERGDSYVTAILQSAQSIAHSMNLPYKVGFQSKMGRMKWVGPDTVSVLKELSAEEIEEILIIPISFLTENLETLYDIDYEIIPLYKTTFTSIHKVSLTDAFIHLVPLFQAIIQ